MADDDIGLPKSTMLRAIKERLPADMRIAGDVNDMIVRCCEEFIHLVSTAANELCEKEKKSTILPEHILGALENLGFEPYLENLKKVYEDWKEEKKEEQKAAKEKKKAKAGGDLSAEELLALQQQLFQQARERTLGITSGQGTAAPGGTTTAGPSEAAQ